jgi:hypothetical protein
LVAQKDFTFQYGNRGFADDGVDGLSLSVGHDRR